MRTKEGLVRDIMKRNEGMLRAIDESVEEIAHGERAKIMLLLNSNGFPDAAKWLLENLRSF
jgi:hypothetical protein